MMSHFTKGLWFEKCVPAVWHTRYGVKVTLRYLDKNNEDIINGCPFEVNNHRKCYQWSDMFTNKNFWAWNSVR